MAKACTHCGEVKPLAEYGRKLDRYNAHCKACQRLKNVAYRAKNKEALDAKNAQYRRENAEQINAQRKEYRAANAAKIKAGSQVQYQRLKNDPAYKAKVSAYEKKWRQANKDRVNETKRKNRQTSAFKVRNAAISAQRRACMPKWVNGADIRIFYEIARRLTASTGIPHEVDHIVPIRGKTVSGLHVPWNLRVITASENRKKKNIFVELEAA